MIHLYDLDPRQHTDPSYLTNMGSFAVVAHGLNSGLKKIGAYSEPDEAKYVGICDGLQLNFRYKDKIPFVINVWETINALTTFHLEAQQRFNPILFGLSKQISDLWKKYGVDAPVVYGGCDTDFWRPICEKNEVFTFLSVNFSNLRSGLDLAVQAYWAAFGNSKKVQFIIKNTSGSARLKERIAEYKTKGANIIYLEGRYSFEQMRELYSKSHVCLNVLRHTSFGLPLLESSACGCPSITGDFAPTNELIRPGGGILLKPIGEVNIQDKMRELAGLWGLTDCYGGFHYDEPPKFYDFSIYEYAKIMMSCFENKFFLNIDSRTPIIDNWKWEDQARKLAKYLA